MKKITIVALLALVATLGIAPSVLATVCAQVITNAVSPSGECRSFPTPCDVPAGWTTVSDCSSSASANIDDINSRLQQMRLDLKEFKDKKSQEVADRDAALKEKITSKRKTIEARIAAAKKTKEEKRKTVLLNLVDIQIKQFTNTEERVAKMTNIRADLKTQLSTNIDIAIAELNTEKTKIQAATAPEELKNLAKEIRDLLKSRQEIVKQIVKAILASRTDTAVVKAENRLAEIKAKIAELKAAGKDVAETEGLFASAEQKVVSAKEKSGQKMAKETIDFLKSAYHDMKDIVKKVDTEKTAFFCPQEKYINCMPIVTPERQKLCSGEYYEWIKKNCLNAEFTY
ncbi:hypothetical protein KKG29_04580 [Patescibacteria group bacterium]|nr:hypothetical protein [Patescibacteria group bacterium]MBU4000413.1 hypothetical protein [Patescibacteria group bacterium]MBU4056835.1 hypothetical protein [Patescibacteria group bacterium]MBU4368313.1 hypothetical protein [Patescibacteria group bacterium]